MVGVNIHQPFWCEPGPQGFVPQPKWVHFFSIFQLHREQQEHKRTTNSSQYLLAMFSPHYMRFGQDPTVRACAILESHSCDSCFLLTDGQGPDGWMLVMLLQNTRHPTLEASKFNQCRWCAHQCETTFVNVLSPHKTWPNMQVNWDEMWKNMLHVPGLFLSCILMLTNALLNSVHGVFGYCFRESICFVSTIHVLHVFTHASHLVDGSWGVLMVTVLWLCDTMCIYVSYSPFLLYTVCIYIQYCIYYIFYILYYIYIYTIKCWWISIRAMVNTWLFCHIGGWSSIHSKGFIYLNYPDSQYGMDGHKLYTYIPLYDNIFIYTYRYMPSFDHGTYVGFLPETLVMRIGAALRRVLWGAQALGRGGTLRDPGNGGTHPLLLGGVTWRRIGGLEVQPHVGYVCIYIYIIGCFVGAYA